MRGIVLLVALVGAFTWVLGKSAYAQDAADQLGPRLVEEQVRIPAKGYTIAATILRPAGHGPFGAVVLNHGAPVTPEERRLESSAMLIHTAAIFAQHGYVVVMPLRRGFGATGGEFAEDAGTCRNPDYFRGESAAADDIMAAYEYTRALPYVDGSRMILAGQSAGGVSSLFTAGDRHPQGLVAVLAFAAGRGGNPSRNPGVPCAAAALGKVFTALGKEVKVPVLFNYAENDEFFGPHTSRLWFDRFAAGGADAQYVLQPAFGKNGHYIFSDDAGVKYWLPTVEHFLAQHGVPFDSMQPGVPSGQPMLAGH